MDYPTYKKVAWRFARVFIATFLITFADALTTTSEPTVAIIRAIVLSSLSAGVVAMGKLMREYLGYDTKGEAVEGSLVRKLPF